MFFSAEYAEGRQYIYNPDKAAFSNLDEMNFIESNGYAAIEVEHYWHKVEVNGVGWQRIAEFQEDSPGRGHILC